MLAHIDPVRAAAPRVDDVDEAIEGAHDQVRLERVARGEQREHERSSEDLTLGAHGEGVGLSPRLAVEHVHQPRGRGHHHLQRAVAA